MMENVVWLPFEEMLYTHFIITQCKTKKKLSRWLKMFGKLDNNFLIGLTNSQNGVKAMDFLELT